MDLKQKKKMVIAAAALLTVCAILLVSSSFAWIALSRMPEVSGMSTNIGSNGSLEIALVNTDSYIDPSNIAVKVGGSLENADPLLSNLQWGSVVDLSNSDYGLHDVTLIPSRLQVDENHVVGTGLLSIPDYGADGRFQSFSKNTLYGSYRDDSIYQGAFVFNADWPEFGVRGIGSALDITPQQSALTQSRIAIESYQNSAVSAFKSYWETSGTDFMTVFHWYYGSLAQPEDQFTMKTLNDMATQMLVILDYIDSAYREGILGFVSIMVQDEAQFAEIESVVMNKQIPMSMILENLPEEVVSYLPFDFAPSVTLLESSMLNMYEVQKQYQAYLYYGYADPSTLVSKFFDSEETYFNSYGLYSYDDVFGWNNISWTDDNIISVYGEEDVIGAFNAVSFFLENFNAFCQYEGTSVEFESVSYYSYGSLKSLLSHLEMFDPYSSGSYLYKLQDVYGFAIDMAFRCNTDCDLLLQTSGTSRGEYDSVFGDNQGAGSYMRFSSEQMSTNQILLMMDALRIGFVDNQHNLLAVAKLNTSNYEASIDGVNVPLYLYDYTVQPNGTISIGERMAENSSITSLCRNNPVVITAVVWLDGDYVDNSLAAIRDQSMVGVLNLQFSSSADLKPAFGDDTEGTEPSENNPTEPEQTEPTVEDEIFYYEQLATDEYTIYALNSQGDKAYEMVVTTGDGSVTDCLHIQSVSSVTGDTIFVPSTVTDPISDTAISMQINPVRPFQTLENAEAVSALKFVAADDNKVLVSADSLRDFLGDHETQERDIQLVTFDGSGLDTTNVTDMNSLFKWCGSLTSIDLSGWDTSNVTDMDSMFYYCESVQHLDVSHFDTSNVTDFGFMFSNCKLLNELDITSWDTGSATDIHQMFNYCSSLTQLDVSSLNLQNVTSMEGLFSACTSLKQIDVSVLDTSNVQNMMMVFHMCSSLERVDLSSWDTSNVTSVSYLFSYCENLESVNMGGWDVSGITHANNMFYQCTALTDLTLPQWDLTNVETTNMFTDCPAGANYIN